MSAISLRVQHAFPGFTLDVDLQLPGRGVTALFGHSGSGKTTLLRCMAGLERAAQAHIALGDECWQSRAGHFTPTWQREIGYVFQEASLFPHLDVRANLAFGMKRTTGAVCEDEIRAMAARFGIEHLLARKPDGLSGGERQRVAIARALLTRPRLLLMDEPLSALDLPRKREILPYLEKLHDELDIPLLYVTHSADEVARLADHLVVLDNGRALADGPLAETLARVDLPIRLGDEAGVVLDTQVGQRDETWQLARFDFDGGSLWARDPGLPEGHTARVRVLARDVSVSRQHDDASSIQNHLPATITAIASDEHPSLALVQARVGSSLLVARLTRRAASQLQLAVGDAVWLQVKSVALME